MKTIFKFLFILLVCNTSNSQKKNIETESIAIDNLINFVVENYAVDLDSVPKRNITFLLETYGDTYDTEDKVLLKQAFKLISKRLTDKDSISIVAYSKYSGVILNRTEATNKKKLLYAIENPISSITYLEEDGIGLAYKIGDECFTEDTENSVVMIRIPKSNIELESKKSKSATVTEANTKSRKGNTVVLTAIALLPELIRVIKD